MVCHWTSAVLVSRKKGIECVLLFYLKWLPRLILSQKRTFWRHLLTKIKILGAPGPTPVRQNETPTTMVTHYKTGTCYFFSDCVLGGNRSMCLQTRVSTLRHLKSKFPFHPNFEAIKVVEKKCDDRTKTSAIWIRFQKKKERYCHDLQSKLQRKGNNLLQIVQQFKIRWKSYPRSITPATGGVKVRR